MTSHIRTYTPALSPEPRPREIAERVNAALRGKLNSTGSVTLTASSATTTLTDINIGHDSVVLLSPKTANAKAEGTPWVSPITSIGSATLNHLNNAQTDRDYDYLIVG